MIRTLTRPLTRPLTRALTRPALDPDAEAFQIASGATDVSGIDAIASYMRAEGLRDNYRLIPLISAQNAGSGSTAYGIGGLTADHMTLVNGPAWGASAMTFAAGSSQYGSLPDFFSTETITQFFRANLATGIGDRVIAGQRQSSPEARSCWMALSGTSGSDNLVLNRTSSGSFASGSEVYRNTSKFSEIDRTYVSQWLASGGRSFWWDKTSIPLTLFSGTDQTQHADVGSLVTIMAGIGSGAPIFPTSGTVVAAMWVRGALTTAQRETLIDLINAL